MSRPAGCCGGRSEFDGKGSGNTPRSARTTRLRWAGTEATYYREVGQAKATGYGAGDRGARWIDRGAS